MRNPERVALHAEAQRLWKEQARSRGKWIARDGGVRWTPIVRQPEPFSKV